MTTAFLTYDPASGVVLGPGFSADGTLPADAIACSTAQAESWKTWHVTNETSSEGHAVRTLTPASPAVAVLSLVQQAQEAVAAGLTITSTATPSLSGRYACDAAAQLKLARMNALIQRTGGVSFPAGLTALPWPDMTGTAHFFNTVIDFVNFETALGNYVLALDLIMTTKTGVLPSNSVTIP